jgi:glutaredoxin 3
MPRITVYSGPGCPYCDRAKALLKKKGAQFEDINIRADPTRLEEMKQKSGGKQTIPQIFIDDMHIGGCEELYALDAKGGLDPLLTR